MKRQQKIAVKAPSLKRLSGLAHYRENEEKDGQEKNPQVVDGTDDGSARGSRKITKARRPGFTIAAMHGTGSFLDPDEDRPE